MFVLFLISLLVFFSTANEMPYREITHYQIVTEKCSLTWTNELLCQQKFEKLILSYLNTGYHLYGSLEITHTRYSVFYSREVVKYK